MENRVLWNCPTCTMLPFRYGQQSVLQHDGVNGYCEGCNTQVTRVHCKDCTPAWEQWWFPLAELLVSRTCPMCKVPLLVGEEILKSSAPDSTKQVVAAGILIAAFFGALHLIDMARKA